MKNIIKHAAVFAALGASAGWAVASDAQADAAGKRLEHFRNKPSFEAPGPAFDAKQCMKDKSILSIPVSSANPFTKNIENAMKSVATKIGFNFREWENQGQPSQWVQGIEYAINNRFDLIDLLGGTEPRVLSPQVKAATSAGVKVVVSHSSGFEQPVAEGLSGSIPVDYFKAGQILGDWAIWKTKAKVNAIVLVSTEVYATGSILNGIEQQLKKECDDCKFKVVNVPVPEWSTKIQPTIQSALISDPSINYVIPIYDSMSQFVVPALTITGKANAVKIATFNGTPFVLGLIQQGQVEMDIGESLDWIGHAMLDGQMRIICGLPAVKDPKIPFYIFDSANVNEAGKPPALSTGYGDSYKKGYEKLWKLAPQ